MLKRDDIDELVSQAFFLYPLRSLTILTLQMIAGVPQFEEWDRFRHHAIRVRSLTVGDHEPYRVQYDALQKICQIYPGPYPLPRLRCISCDDGAELGDEWEKLMPPTLEEASMITSDEDNTMAFLGSLLACGSVKRLYYDEGGNLWGFNQGEVRAQVSRVVGCLPNLTVVRVGPLLPLAIRHLATLPALKTVELVLDSSTDYLTLLSASEESAPFLTLTELHVQAPAASSKALLGLLDAIRRTKLERIDVTFGLDDEAWEESHAHTPAESQGKYLNRVTEALARFTSLESIGFYTCEQHQRSASLIFDEDALAQLLQLERLASLDAGSHPMNFSPLALSQMASAWHSLRRLELGHDCDTDAPAHSVEDLLPFTTSCPNLEALGVKISGDVSPLSLSKRPAVEIPTEDADRW